MDTSDSPFSITSDDLLVAHMVTKFLTRIRFQAVIDADLHIRPLLIYLQAEVWNSNSNKKLALELKRSRSTLNEERMKIQNYRLWVFPIFLFPANKCLGFMLRMTRSPSPFFASLLNGFCAFFATFFSFFAICNQQVNCILLRLIGGSLESPLWLLFKVLVFCPKI